MNWNQSIIEAAERYIGLKEWPGARSNPEVEELFAGAGFPGMTDDVPWCAAFVGAVLAEVGLIPSGSLMARSYLSWGRKVAVQDALPGDVMVFSRGAPPSGHVAFFVKFDGSRVQVLGGNQKDQVVVSSYPTSSILAVRRADPSNSSGRATVRKGDRGAMVLDLQVQLAALGYFSGKKDGLFGSLTDASVRAFQSDNQLEVDGVVGNRTWEALKDAPRRPSRDVTEDDLRKRGSTTVKAADTTTLATGAAAGAALIPVVTDVVQQASGVVPTISTLLRDHWPTLIVIGCLALVYLLARRITAARVEAARRGENLSK